MLKAKDRFLNVSTYVAACTAIFILAAILIFIFENGFSSLSWELITSDYYKETYNMKSDISSNYVLNNYENVKNEEYFSTVWGIALDDGKDVEGNQIVEVIYISSQSPFNQMIDSNTDDSLSASVGYAIEKLILSNDNGDYITSYGKDGAAAMIAKLDSATVIKDAIMSEGGGGIKGSLISTLVMIILTLVIALPIGIFAAIYLHEYAKENKLIHIIRAMIDMISGIPSIIFGLVGVVIFIPIMNATIGSNGGSVASGSLTLAVMLLPIIIKTTEESLKTIPDSYRMASLALGASKTQTTFKVILPNTISGLLTATLLSIGRIIGESAALIFAVGTVIKDKIAINNKSTTLAVHIWSLMSGENPNYGAACAISIIILIIVFSLSISVKLLSRKFNKMEVN